MMPDLDRYAGTVLGAYGVTLAMLALLVAMSWWRSTGSGGNWRNSRRDPRRARWPGVG